MKAMHASLVGMLAFCLGCTPPAATPEERTSALGAVHYDAAVIADLPRYQALFTFLLAHTDTLIATRNARHLVTYVKGSNDGLRDTTYAVAEDCHAFFEGNAQYDLKSAPYFLQGQFDSLFHQFSAQRIRTLEVCKEGRIVIGIRADKLTKTLQAMHELIWDPRHQPDRVNTSTYIIDKDTLLPSGCIYRIGLVEDRGW